MQSSPNLGLPYIQPSQAQKHITHNSAIERLDALVQLAVEGMQAQSPPAVPVEGATWAVGAGATGVWAGQEDRLAVWTNGAWIFLDPVEGTRLWDRDSKRLMVWSDGNWSEVVDLTTLTLLGINAAADIVNRLAISAPATLLSHEGGGHQLKINKASAGDTASLLLQSDWSGRAEMGLAGGDDWSLKVSADGSTWIEALLVNATTGHATGAAVQASAIDTTPGRLMRADFGYGPGNLVGTVSESGSAPTGAVIERGSNANGHYTRFADGTQICGFRVDVTPVANTVTDTPFTFPAVFTHDGSSAIDDIFVTVLPFTSVPESTVGTTGFRDISGTGGTLKTYRSNTTSSIYSGIAFGRWY